MGGWDHGPNESDDDQSAATSARNARLGLWLFAVYCSTYALFVGLIAFRPDALLWRPFAGLTLSVVYGLGLIVLAFVLAIAYAWLCRAPVDESRGASR